MSPPSFEQFWSPTGDVEIQLPSPHAPELAQKSFDLGAGAPASFCPFTPA
jgi:hypothetical protein